MRRALLPFALSFSLLVVVFLLFASGDPTSAGSPTFTPPPTLTPIATSTPVSSTPVPTPGPTPGPGPVSTTIGIFYHHWETGSLGSDCGLFFALTPSARITIPVSPAGIKFSASGGFTLCVPRRGELVKDVSSHWYLTSSRPISVSSEIWFLVDLYGEPSGVGLVVDGSCPSAMSCMYYKQVVGSGLYRLVIADVLSTVHKNTWFLNARCRYWEKDNPGYVRCQIFQDVTVCGPDGCGGPGPEPPPPQECCVGPGECELGPGYLRVRGTAALTPSYDVILYSGLSVLSRTNPPGSYFVVGLVPRTEFALRSGRPITYILHSWDCIFPDYCGESHSCVVVPGGPSSFLYVRAFCHSAIGGLNPTVDVIGIPSPATRWVCPITATCTNDLPPIDSGRDIPSYFLNDECSHPGFSEDYRWVRVTGTFSSVANSFAADEYWIFAGYGDLLPSLPISSPIEYRDGDETCFDVPPFADQLNDILSRLFSRTIDSFTICVFPRYFRLVGFPGSAVLFDGLVTLFTIAVALFVIRSIERLGRS